MSSSLKVLTCYMFLCFLTQLWEMDGYCYKVPSEMKPVKDSPPLSLAWRAHLSSIVSIDLAEDKGLIITASTDCCVRMFTLNGRYIGKLMSHDRSHDVS